MYYLKTHDSGYISSAVLARLLCDRVPYSETQMRHLAAIERIGARGISYSNEDVDVLSAAYSHVCSFIKDQPLDPPGYALRVAALEAEGMTTSDAQGIADMEFAAGGVR